MKPITYTSDQPGDYANALAAADTMQKLMEVVVVWKPLAEDAYRLVHSMTSKDFRAWRKGYASERKGKFAGEEFAVKYGSLMMPTLMFKVAMVAVKYHVPWGCAYLRLKETGTLDKVLG